MLAGLVNPLNFPNYHHLGKFSSSASARPPNAGCSKDRGQFFCSQALCPGHSHHQGQVHCLALGMCRALPLCCRGYIRRYSQLSYSLPSELAQLHLQYLSVPHWQGTGSVCSPVSYSCWGASSSLALVTPRPAFSAATGSKCGSKRASFSYPCRHMETWRSQLCCSHILRASLLTFSTTGLALVDCPGEVHTHDEEWDHLSWLGKHGVAALLWLWSSKE